MLALKLPIAIQERLDRLAKDTGRAKSYYVREALVRYLDDLEDINLAERRLEDIRAGRSHTIPLEDVMREHGNLEG